MLQNLYRLGARRIGVTSLPPTGCLPAAITLFGAGSNQCVERLNRDAILFNNKLNTTSRSLKKRLPGLKLVVFDIYQPLLDIVTNPADNGMCLKKCPYKSHILMNKPKFFNFCSYNSGFLIHGLSIKILCHIYSLKFFKESI